MAAERPIILATRGSALALAQTDAVLAQLRAAFPRLVFEKKIIKTTGDKLQTASLAGGGAALPKGLFTKELEAALLKRQADMAVHSLKDLPVSLPAGLKLGAVGKRADVRDVLIYRDQAWLEQEKKRPTVEEWTPGQERRRGFRPKAGLKDLPGGFVVATSSARRKAQLLALRPDLVVVEIRGNVVTRLKKLAERFELDATILAAAGLERLRFTITASGHLQGDAVPDGLLATRLDVEEMVPCVGQAAVGIEIRADDERIETLCQRLNHHDTWVAVAAERAFLAAMGGGCNSAAGAYAEVHGRHLRMQAVALIGGTMHRVEERRPLAEAIELGQFLAAELSGR